MMTNSSNNKALISGFVAGAAAAGSLWFLQQQRQRQKKDRTSTRTTTTAEAYVGDLIYMDYNGTTPVYPDVFEAMVPYLQQHYGNPNSSHAAGDVPRVAVDAARRQILTRVLGCSCNSDSDSSDSDPSSSSSSAVPLSACIFTSCGTESDNLAIHLALLSRAGAKKGGSSSSSGSSTLPHVVACNVEHAAVDGCLLAGYEDAGRCTVTRVPVGTDGRVTASDMIAAIRPNTVLVTLMLANNESGALQPVREVSEYCRKKGILIFTDAAQAVGKVSVTLQDMGDPDMVTIVGHKIGAPKGIACLYVRPGCLGDAAVPGLLIGGGQEFGRRGGTENVPYIVGMGVAAVRCAGQLAHNQQHMERMRCRLLSRLQEALGHSNVRVNGPTDPAHRLPNTLSVGFAGGVHSGKLLGAVRDRVAASAGATCHVATGPVSAVLQAMQVPEDFARATVRLSLGPNTTADQVDRAADILAQEVKRQRQL